MCKLRNGFSLVELLVAISIILVLTAIAIPNLWRSRRAANEATAATQLKGYSTAQTTFHLGKYGLNTINSKTGMSGYCDNYRNLYFGLSANGAENAALISRAYANAYARDPCSSCADTNDSLDSPSPEPVPHQGYLYGEPVEMTTPNNGYFTTYALLAVPTEAANTGDNAYWIGQQGTIHYTGLTPGSDYASNITMSTPSSSTVPVTAWNSF